MNAKKSENSAIFINRADEKYGIMNVREVSATEDNQAVERAIGYIEENLQNEISLSAVAAAAGYSVYHFARVFRRATGMTPASYIRRRRISEICRAMESGDRPISEIAFAWGFNSKENFIRAFKTEHHILPTEFKSAQNSLKLYDRLTLCACEPEVKASVKSMDAFDLVVYPCDEETPPSFWNKYNARGWSRRLSGGECVRDFGVSAWDAERNRLNYFIGIEADKARGCREHTVELHIPGGLYALFDTPKAERFDFVSTIHQTWAYIDRVWLPANGYRRTGGYELESYVENSHTYSETIYIPIERKDEP